MVVINNGCIFTETFKQKVMTQFEVVQLMIDKAKSIHNKQKENVSPKEYDILQAQFDVLMETITTVQAQIDKELNIK